MKIYVGADHAGFEVKKQIVEYLMSNNHDVVDLGAHEYVASDDYPDFAIEVAKKVTGDNTATGIVLCGSGTGVTIAANKVKGARATYIESAEHARIARADDDANIMALSAMTFDPHKTFEMIETWINTPFSNAERHVRRRDKITKFENAN